MPAPLIVILADDTDEEDHALLFALLDERSVDTLRVHPADLAVSMDADTVTFRVHDRELSPDLVIGWVLDDLLIPGMAHLDVFARLGVPVINDALTLFRAQNKYLDSSLQALAGLLPYPVFTGHDRDAALRWLRGRTPAVVKPLSGHGGRGLRLIPGPEEAPAILDALLDARVPYYLVPYIDNPGRDIRVYTINHHPVFAMYRYAAEGQWITNMLAGGAAAHCPLTEEIAAVASAASRAAGTLIGGIDIGENRETGELVVYEVNSCPTCEPPVLLALADFLAEAVVDLPHARATWRPTRDYARPPYFHPSKRLHEGQAS